MSEGKNAVLDCPMTRPNGADAATVREYLAAMLGLLWSEGEDFSSKRPFGNSGWQNEVYVALVEGGVVPGSIDDYGDFDADFDENAADMLILAAIAELGKAS